MHRAVRVLPLTVAVLAAAGWLTFWLVGGGGNSRAAQSAPPRQSCAQTLLRDWADGRIDGTYPVACYRAALRSLPADLRVYSSAADDITAALQSRIIQSARHPAG